MTFSDKDPDEEEYLGFNFLPRLATGETISNVAFTVAVVAGTDPAAADMLLDSPVIDGGTVKQMVGAGVAGVHYRVSAEITTSAGQTLVEAGDMVVRTIG